MIEMKCPFCLNPMTWLDVNTGLQYYCSMCRMPWREIDGELKVVIQNYFRFGQTKIENFNA